MPVNLDTVTKTIEAATAAARAANSITDLALGAVGRGGPRWHRWRALRLRLRAVRLEGTGHKAKAAQLRLRAALHLGYAGGLPEEISMLRSGIEPVALTTG